MITGIASEIEFAQELDKFPSLEILKQNLKDLFEMDKSLLSLKDIKTALFDKAVILPNSYSPLPAETINLLKVFRVRSEKTINLENEDLNLIRTFSYPNPCFCTTNGRANLKGKSVFYCSDNKETALAESNLQIGDAAYLSVWNIKCDREVNSTSFLPTTIPEKNIWYNQALKLQAKAIDHAKQYGGDKSQQLEMVINFFSQTFIKENKPYSITSWISNNLLYEYDFIDFLVYPSYATNNYSCNLAFHPNFVDQFMKLETIFKMVIKEKGNDSITFNITESGTAKRTNIIWGDIQQDSIDQYFRGASKIEPSLNSA